MSVALQHPIMHSEDFPLKCIQHICMIKIIWIYLNMNILVEYIYDMSMYKTSLDRLFAYVVHVLDTC